MTARAYLEQAYRLDQRISSKLQQVENLRSLTQRITQSYDNEVVSRTRNMSSGEDAIIRLMEAEKELNRQIDALIEIKISTSNLIEEVHNENYKLILEKRYLCFLSWNQIAEEMQHSRRWVQQTHERALAVVEQLIRKQEGSA